LLISIFSAHLVLNPSAVEVNQPQQHHPDLQLEVMEDNQLDQVLLRLRQLLLRQQLHLLQYQAEEMPAVIVVVLLYVHAKLLPVNKLN
jgi:hypothetical protein